MSRFFGVLAVAIALCAIALPTAGAALTDGLLQGALDDLVTWDSGFAPFADPPPNGHEYVVGSHKVTLGTQFQHIRVSAHSLPGGVSPKGSVEITFTTTTGTVDLKGDVDCLNVGPGIGQAEHPGQTEADVDAILRQPYQGNTHVRLIFIDNGNPGPAMGESPDLAFWQAVNFSPPHNCSDGGSTLLGDQSGNIVAHDVVE
jgi:hypothetical protein